MKNQQFYQIDIKNNKVKEGFLVKRSRILKEWKQRWMVLTKTHLYSFTQKQNYKNPTEKIPLKQVFSIKSYYKGQYSRPEVIRIQSADTEFYLSAKNHQDKWAWMTAIQKMTHKQTTLVNDQETIDTQNLIRETIRLSTAIRRTIYIKNQKKDQQSNQKQLKRWKLTLDSNSNQVTVIPTSKPKIFQQDIKQSAQISLSKQNQSLKQITQKIKQIIIEKQKIVYVPEIKEKIVYVPEIKEKIVYVPEIKQVIKTVYVTKQPNSKDSKQELMSNKQTLKNFVDLGFSQNETNSLLDFFQDVLELRCQNPKPLIEFIVYLAFTEVQKYTNLTLTFTTNSKVHHTFSNVFLQIMNEQIEQQKLNSYIKFITIIYQNNLQYFYSNDLKLLIQILLRELQMNRSYFNQYLIISLFDVMSDKQWFKEVKHRREELVKMLREIRSWISDSDCVLLIQEVLRKI